MAAAHSKRSFASLKLTSPFRTAYMGAWILMSVFLVALMNFLLYLLIRERWGDLAVSGGPQEYFFVKTAWIVLMTVEAAGLIVAIYGLAVFTVHRIAGPYIRLRNAMNEVADGNVALRVKFRDNDHLQDLEAAFNRMMESIAAAMPGKDQP